jgi:hypothetical protein
MTCAFERNGEKFSKIFQSFLLQLLVFACLVLFILCLTTSAPLVQGLKRGSLFRISPVCYSYNIPCSQISCAMYKMCDFYGNLHLFDFPIE